MNSAARLMNQGSLSRSWVVTLVIARIQFSTLSLIFMLIVTALSMVYVTNSARGLHASIQETLIERNQLHVQWGQLLLEKSTWVTPARVEHVAFTRMGMITPDSHSVVIINE